MNRKETIDETTKIVLIELIESLDSFKTVDDVKKNIAQNLKEHYGLDTCECGHVIKDDEYRVYTQKIGDRFPTNETITEGWDCQECGHKENV